MSTYDYHLPDAFPVCFVVSEEVAKDWVYYLIEKQPPATNGSSFAVTADTNHENHRKIWLSAVSVERLKEARLIT